MAPMPWPISRQLECIGGNGAPASLASLVLIEELAPRSPPRGASHYSRHAHRGAPLSKSRKATPCSAGL
eukprot:scaffold6789_cov115-Isochrysis_galbana.AAC.2